MIGRERLVILFEKPFRIQFLEPHQGVFIPLGLRSEFERSVLGDLEKILRVDSEEGKEEIQLRIARDEHGRFIFQTVLIGVVVAKRFEDVVEFLGRLGHFQA